MPLLAELVLVSRILGVITGEYPVDLIVDPSVHSVEILRNGKIAATLRSAPWHVPIDFGSEIMPQELTAIAYDANRNELARDTQFVNLARPTAELDVSLERDPATNRLRATAHWKHIGEARTKRIEVKLDGKRIGSSPAVLLPHLEGTGMHVFEAEVRFADGVVARKELVFGGLYAEQVPSELTAVLVRRKNSGSTDLGTCFRLGGEPVRAAGIERSEALALFVRDPDQSLAMRTLRDGTRASGLIAILQARARFGLPGVKMQILWPVARTVRARDAETGASLFYRTSSMEGDFGTHWLLTATGGPKGEQYRFADGVTVAGVLALNGARRRAVVLVVGERQDESQHAGPIVRRYLERVGVPLRVWSLVGVRPEIVEAWGPVTDVSSTSLLERATEELRREFDQQWIVWMPVGPLDALAVTAAPDCAFVPVSSGISPVVVRRSAPSAAAR